MKKTPLKKIGKTGKANIQARKDIAEQCEALQLNRCELELGGCLGQMYLAPAHRHKRAWYKGNAVLLADYNQWVAACVHCHDKIEFDAELTEKMFSILRGEE